jgi:endonuclease YncB( thermonuclease family)
MTITSPDDWRKNALPSIPEPPNLYWYMGEIAKDWSDGDTVTIHIDLGFGHYWNKVKFRLARIDAFGKTHPKNAEVLELLGTVLPVGKRFYFRSVKDKTEKWGRYLAEVYIQVDDVGPLINMNDILVKQGLALYWEGQGEHPTGEIVRG